MSRPWWRDGVVYQIYPRSFRDTTGNGVGDLAGVARGLDHLAWLGADAIWLSPIYPSPMADFGYDVADYCDIDPLFGDLDDFDSLVAAAHRRGIRVLLDWVPNHTSSEHPWFQASRSSPDDPKRDWYVWRDPRPDGGPPNNWTAAFAPDRPAWTLDPATGQYYLHHFLPEQPDLNWSNPQVQRALHDVLRFWLARGVDGFRADVVHLIGKDASLPDDPPERAGQSRVGFHDDPATHELLRGVRAVLDEFSGDRMMVGEINLSDSAAIARYLGEGDQLHLAFDFSLLRADWDAGAWREAVAAVEAACGPRGAWPTWTLANHDEPRPVTRYDSLARARAAAVTLLSLRGTPFLYAGEELGLPDADVPPERQIDPGGRDGCRAPLPWEEEDGHGWAGQPWLPWPPEPAAHSVEAQRRRWGSTLTLYRRMLEARRDSEALRAGSAELFDVHPDVLAVERRAEDDLKVLLTNFAAMPVRVPLEGHWRVEVASDRLGEGMAYPGCLEGEQAVVLRPKT